MDDEDQQGIPTRFTDHCTADYFFKVGNCAKYSALLYIIPD